MSFVPVTGPATFRAAEPPRDGVVEFTDERRTVSLPIRAALPVLTKARLREDLHPSVGLLAGAALLAMRLVAAGKFAPAAAAGRRAGGSPASTPTTRTGSRCWRRSGTEDEAVVRGLLDAVADAMPRSAPSAAAVLAPRRDRQPTFEQRLQARLARHQRLDPRDLPQLVTISLRVEADEEELVAGAVRLVPQVHDEQNPLHLCDLALLWTDTPTSTASATGRGPTPRSRCGRRPTRGRCSTGCSSCGCPTSSCSTPTSWSACSTRASARCEARGVDVLWPRASAAT